MEIITSNQNSRVKLWTSLQTAKGRQQSGSYLLDGWHLVQEALNQAAPIQAVIATEAQMDEHLADVPQGVPAFQVTDEVARHIAKTNNPQGIFAQTSLPNNSFDPKYVHAGQWLLLDRIQDPGNVGTLVRTADAAGFVGVALSVGSADPFGPKVVRAMQGSQFHLKVIKDLDLATWIDDLEENNYDVYGTTLSDTSVDYKTVVPEKSFALILGNEGQGLDPELLEKTSANLHINFLGKAESLNVAVAGGILMFALN
ncbi:MAG: RNA methyltransferase [Oenococcus sp.]|uniref:TrmH family RNA methyltransferase n=1 Tax=Oenococcus TaxID=46254 RepID=UPI0021E8C465|nr:RNA methyltransferase [Oenococcus kitaharae]MCV3295715.1 RNA methyltransferase [Oenococcus kitaharae]